MYKFFTTLEKEEFIQVDNRYPIAILGLVSKKDITPYGGEWNSGYIIALQNTEIETIYGIYPMPIHSTAVFPLGIILSIETTGCWILFSKDSTPMQVNGPIESVGRLKYIDGARDSIVIQPPKVGLPCLNIMYFPPSINQHSHTHPSLRVAVVMQGIGTCDVAEDKYDLVVGSLLVMTEDITHAFQSKTDLVVATYHPDSENGPTDEAHPMISRTYVNNKPVIESMPEIVTK
jgi:mannose-6-phosphate isomerase-like protein (cupin superfamily)